MNNKTVATIDPPYKGEFLDLLTASMEAEGIGIKELKDVIDMSSEHTRKFVRGLQLPARPILRLMSQHFSWDFEEAWKLVQRTELKKNYGDVLLEMAGKNPELDSIDQVWHMLTKSQKKDATAMVVSWANGNKKK